MQKIQLIISIIILISAIPLGLWLAHLTRDEKNIYKKPMYSPAIIWIIALIAAIFYTLNIKIALTLTFIFILILTWYKSDKINKILKIKT